MPNRSTSERSINTPKPEFDNKGFFWGNVLGVMALRAVKGKAGTFSEGIAKRIIANDSTVTSREVTAETLAKVEATSQQTEYWHGTGRYQYRDSKVVDILKNMIEQGGLRPHSDDIDLIGVMDSVSLARSRTYARTYADLHENGEKGERNGSTLLWASAFMGSLALKVVQEEKMWHSSNRQRVLQHFETSSSRQWYKKVRQTPTGTIGTFARGSDIEGNYPILFGIKTGAVTPALTSASVALHEVRSTNPVGFDDLTHIEVPASKQLETQTMLAEAGIEVPVMAIEDFEAYAARQSFAEQVR